MKAGSFKLDDYLERLTEEKEVNSKVPAEGIIMPEENKKTFNWLKKEFQKGKTEVKVEMKMGGQKFEPGYDLQTNLKSVKDFKPGMFGDVKTSDTEGGIKKEEGQDASKTSGEKSAKKEPKGVVVKAAETEEKEEHEEHEHEEHKVHKEEDKVHKKEEHEEHKVHKKEEHEEHEEKKGEEEKKGGFKPFKKKVNEGLEIVQEGTQDLEPEALAYLSSLPFTRKPGLDDLYYSKKIQVDSQLETILSLLPVVNFETYEDFLDDYGEDFPFKKFFIANVEEDDGVTFLVRTEGYSDARYVAELI
jgi:hypothetical protein